MLAIHLEIIFANWSKRFLCVAVKVAYLFDFADLDFPKWSPLGSISADAAVFALKKRAEIEASKIHSFDFNLEGPAAEGRPGELCRFWQNVGSI